VTGPTNIYQQLYQHPLRMTVDYKMFKTHEKQKMAYRYISAGYKRPLLPPFDGNMNWFLGLAVKALYSFRKRQRRETFLLHIFLLDVYFNNCSLRYSVTKVQFVPATYKRLCHFEQETSNYLLHTRASDINFFCSRRICNRNSFAENMVRQTTRI
jgi:hypothetical protein